MNILDVWPFTEELVINHLCDKTLSLGKFSEEDHYYPTDKISLNANMKISSENNKNGFWEVDEGRLFILDERRKRINVFKSIETCSGSIYFTGDNLYSKRSEKICLSPFVSFADSGLKMKFCIASHIDYYEIALPKLIKSVVRKNKIAKEDVVIFINGSEKEEQRTMGGIQYNFITHNSWEYGALIDIVEKSIDVDYWFLLHDTCELDDNFMSIINGLDFGLQFDMGCTVRTKRKERVLSSFNMGFYRYEFLKKIKDLLMSLKNVSKSDGISVEIDLHGTGIRSKAELLFFFNGENNQGFSVMGEKDIYGTGKKRHILYLPDSGIYKYVNDYDGITSVRTMVHKP